MTWTWSWLLWSRCSQATQSQSPVRSSRTDTYVLLPDGRLKKTHRVRFYTPGKPDLEQISFLTKDRAGPDPAASRSSRPVPLLRKAISGSRLGSLEDE